ncbi:putative toxin-antitoxin system toxin component, PIN family [Blastomonas sp.]|uniref:putative toxin-antitoxin system toxin component, PIN family n=1 Tax=Blastomonas sp. TaxID=1909299 RepID=UPI0035946EA1
MRADRIVLDTNVLISAALQPKGPPRATIDAVRAAGGVLIFSDETYEELRSRLTRPKFDRYVSADARDRFIVQVQAASEWVAISGAVFGCRDPDDDKLLETALAGDAGCLVTGDKDLLIMSPYRSLPILEPRAFLAALAATA